MDGRVVNLKFVDDQFIYEWLTIIREIGDRYFVSDRWLIVVCLFFDSPCFVYVVATNRSNRRHCKEIKYKRKYLLLLPMFTSNMGYFVFAFYKLD